jgi:hypothetical protein
MPTPDPNAELPDEVRTAAAEAEAAVAARADAARALADAIDPKPTVAQLVDQLDASVEAAKAAKASSTPITTDATDRAPDPDDPEQAAAAAEAQGVLPPGGLALLGPEVASQCRHQVLPDGTAMVVIRLEHAAGSTIVGLSLGHALQLSNNIRAEHRKAELATRANRNGKLIVPGVKLPPPGDLRAPGQ